ncbi:MAG TPA: hypothetical protein VMV49_07735 [Candidatus Deferrimicrobium sp.]|nr:hypothetical protein [Candidatus Deferrimicrobium sp.]
MVQNNQFQNFLLTRENPSKISKINFYINTVLFSSFILYQLTIMFSKDSPLRMYPLNHILYCSVVLFGLLYLIVRSSKMNSSSFSPNKTFLYFIGFCTLFIIAYAWPTPPTNLEIRALGFAPWYEESWRFIFFILFYDLFLYIIDSLKISRAWTKLIAIILPQFIFYFIHSQYNPWDLEIFLRIGVATFVFTSHLVLMENYLIPIITHFFYNYTTLIYANAIPFTVWCALLFFPFLISIPYYWYFVRKANQIFSF